VNGIYMLALIGPFSNVDDAAIAGLRDSAALSHNEREWGGVIYRRGQSYFYTVPDPGEAFGVDLGPAYAALPGESPVADFHVHICSPYNRAFSPFFSSSDATVNQGLHTVGYMMSLCDGNVHRYDPSQDERDDEEVDLHSGRVLYLTIGHIVGWIDLK
jgi:hypothetical protein